MCISGVWDCLFFFFGCVIYEIVYGIMTYVD